MGVRGLTTFINNRSDLYLKPHKLHDCTVIIDGNSIASTLYKWHCAGVCHDSFTGDYDKYAKVIDNFFNKLDECKVSSIVVFDGGYEKRKLKTVLSRMKNKIMTASIIDPTNEDQQSVFPLFLREVFVDLALERVKCVRCVLEGDETTAALAKRLQCPVLSYDSDYYILGSQYIPFSTLDFSKIKSDKTFKYMPCKIYTIDALITSFGGLQADLLPLLSVLLGNDYINGTVFRPFYRNLKMYHVPSGQSDQQKRIKSLIQWLRNETSLEESVDKVLNRFKNSRRKLVLRMIQRALSRLEIVEDNILRVLGMDGSDQVDSETLIAGKLSALALSKEDNIDSEDTTGDTNNVSSEEEEGSNHSDLDSLSEVDECSEDECTSDQLHSNIFQLNYTSCKYPACCMDMIRLRRYYCVPQVELSSLEHAHVQSIPLVTKIDTILNPKARRGLSIVYRLGKTQVRFATLRKDDTPLPNLAEINELSEEKRRQVMLSCFSITDNDFARLCDKFPQDWCLFLLSIKFSPFDSCLTLALVMSFLILNIVDEQIGFCRSLAKLEKKYPEKALSDPSDCQQQPFQLKQNDCVEFMRKAIKSFQIDWKVSTNPKVYDKNIVHEMAQVQSVLLHAKYLNSLLNFPFPVLLIHRILNGTFVYNMTKNLRSRHSVIDYLETWLLPDCPSIFETLRFVYDRLCEEKILIVNQKGSRKNGRKRRNKKTTKQVEEGLPGESVGDDEEDGTFDPNNRFAMLALM